VRRGLAIAAAFVLVSTAALTATGFAQTTGYPQRKITFIVGFAPGGGIDVFTRILAQELGGPFGYQIVIENRPGSASNIAAQIVATSPPDGYTFLVTGNSFAINQTMSKDLTYSVNQLRPVAFPARDSHALAVNADSSAQSLAQFIALAKDKPVSAAMGGSSSHIVADYVLKVKGQAAGGLGTVSERSAGHECAAWPPGRYSGRSGLGSLRAAQGGQSAGARRQWSATRAGLAGRADADRVRFSGPRNQRLDRPSGSRQDANRGLR
jgi:hypothetical protein